MRRIADTPELQSAITAVLKDPTTTIITEIPSLSKKKVLAWMVTCIDFMKENAQGLGSVSYAIELCTTSVSVGPLSAKMVIKQFRAGFNVFRVDHSLNVMGYGTLHILSGSSLSQYSRKHGCAVMHIINGVDFIIYANGMTVGEMNTNRPTMRPPVHKATMRSGHDYELSIQEHYKSRIRFSQACSHWKNRNKRLLVGNRKTEDIFQENLLNWLHENLYDSRVLGKVNKLSKDETDIEILLLEGDYYLLEIKWLGQNESGTKYSINRIEDGISQVKNYLLRDTNVLEAALIIYDGRPLDEFRAIKQENEEPDQWKKITRCGNKILPTRGKAYVFFLENEDASKREQP